MSCKPMIENTIALYRARKDPALAARIASEIAVDGAIERVSWPLIIVKFWMSVGLIILTLLTAMFLWIGTVTHWTLAIPIFLFGGLTYLIVKVWRGLNRGKDKVTAIAKAQAAKQMDRFNPPPA